MISIFRELHHRNPLLSVVGWVYVFGAIILFLLMPFISVEVLGINALIKPSKFLVSSILLNWTLAWLLYYLTDQSKVRFYSWAVVIVLMFENVYISIQAFQGELSHFNLSSFFHARMFDLMGTAIGIMTVWTAYMAYLFFQKTRVPLAPSYLWGIRLGFLTFVLFALEGYVMGGMQGHTVGAPDGGQGLPYVNWSTEYGDLRIAHFLGMHAIQLLPLAGFYLFRKVPLILAFALFYLVLVTAILIQALLGVPLGGVSLMV